MGVDLFAQNQDYSHLDFHADQGICWGTRPRDYMGWNEIPVDRKSVMDPSNWDSFLIKLPANVCDNGGGDDSIYCMVSFKQTRLEKNIGRYVDQGYLMSGEDHAASRPGSYVVVAREWQDSSGNWFRWFFCENWDGPSKLYGVRFIEKTSTNTFGCCYIEDLGTK